MNSNLEMILNISIRIYDWFYNNVNREKKPWNAKVFVVTFSNEKQSDRNGLSIDLYFLVKNDVKKIEFGFLAISLYLFSIVFILSKDEKMI